MRAYRYLKNADRWVTVIGLFFLGTTFVSQTLWLTKVSIAVCGLMLFARLALKWKMRSLYRKSPQKQTDKFDNNDYEYVFRWAATTWTLFVVTFMVSGFIFSMDWLSLEGLRRIVVGLAIFIGVYTLIVSVRYYQDAKKEKMSGRKEVTAAEFDMKAPTEKTSPKQKNNGGR